MRVGTVASRYAKALFNLAEEKKIAPKVFEEIRAVKEALFADPKIAEALTSQLGQGEERANILKKSLEAQPLSEEVRNLVLLMAERGRLAVFDQVVAAFESQLDASMGVARGEVRSATPLSPQDREHLEKMVHQALKKKVILTYRQDPKVIGGLVAQVGSYTFDDSVESHLRRLNDELKRRVH